MRNRFFAAAAVSLSIATSAVTPAQAMGFTSFARTVAVPSPAQHAVVDERSAFAGRMFCIQYGSACRPTAPRVVAFTNKLRATLSSVNRTVNRTMPAIRSQKEFMSLAPLPNADDDYAMTKRDRLIRTGIPAGALRIEGITSPEGARRSVLIIATSHGDYRLDHLQARITRLADAADSVASVRTIRTRD